MIFAASMPFSGSFPAWAALPKTCASRSARPGAPFTIRPMRPGESSTYIVFAISRLASNAFAPYRPASSPTVKRISSFGSFFPDSIACRTPSKIAATPDKSSAARIVSPEERRIPLSSTGRIPIPPGTRSIWEQKQATPSRSPSRTARILPHTPPNVAPASSRVIENPICSSFFTRQSASSVS